MLQAIAVAAEIDAKAASAIASPVAKALRPFLDVKDPFGFTAQFDPDGHALAKKQAREICDPKAARVYLQLLAENAIPSWAVSSIDLNLLKLLQ